jgi:hypothetical protein
MFAIFGKKAALLTLLLASLAVSALAQDGDRKNLEDRLLECNAIADRLEELACYDAVVESLEARTEEEASTSVMDDVKADSSVNSAAAVVVTGGAAVTVSSQTQRSTASVPVANPDDATAGKEKEDVVANDAIEKETKLTPFDATIVDVWRTQDDRFAVKLDNGQIWRETAGSRITVPKKGWTVKVTKSRFSGYRMEIENRKRLASVRLVD